MVRSGMARMSVGEEKEESREAVRSVQGESAHTSLKTHCWSGASVEPNFVVSCQQAGPCPEAAAMQIGAAHEILPPFESLSSIRAAGPKRLPFGFVKLPRCLHFSVHLL